MPIFFTVDQDPQLEGIGAQFVKIDQRVLLIEALNPKVVLSPPIQGSIVHHLTKAAHRREVKDLLVMIGWSLSKMGLTTAMVPEGRAEAQLVQQGTAMMGAMIALKLMVAAAALVLEMMTGAPLMMMMTTTAICRGAVSHLKKGISEN